MILRDVCLTAGLLALCCTAPTALLAQEGRAPGHQGAIFYYSGADMAAPEDVVRPDEGLNLRISMGRPDGTFTEGGSIRIQDPQGQLLVSTDLEGPIFVAQVPPGNYHVHVDAGGKTFTRAVTVPEQGHVQVALTVPASPGEEPANNRPGILP